jgi:PhzF family phenazine biosynthesis protein
MPTPAFHVDAFTDRPFAGNPALVCLLDGPRDESWMRLVATEMSLPETSFVVRRDNGFSLRWFTPAIELDLCGHGTLAAAHALWESGWLATGSPARFHTRRGLLTAASAGGWIALDFPALAVEAGPIPAAITAALGIGARFTGTCGQRFVVEAASEAAVRSLAPDFALMQSVPGRAVVVTAAADPGRGYDIVSRYFAPWVGANEDPVTGVAHCIVGPFWAARLGRRTLTACQASARGGLLRVGVRGDRVELAGRAVTVLRGELVL